MKKKTYQHAGFPGKTIEFQHPPRARIGTLESKDATPEEFRAARINEAFNYLDREVSRFLEICSCMESPVKSVHIQGNLQGKHVKTHITYHRKPANRIKKGKAINPRHGSAVEI